MKPRMVHPGEAFDRLPTSPDDLLCLDLDEFKQHEDAISWIRQVQQRFADRQDKVLPCIVVIGSAQGVSFEDIQSCISAGAVYYERPSGLKHVDQIVKTLSEELTRIYVEGDQEELNTTDNPRASLQRVIGPDNAELDFYARPPYLLPDEQLSRLFERMKLDDSSPRKSD